MEETQKIPVIRKGENIEISLDSNEISAIVQAIFLISEKFKPEDIENIKKTIEDKGQFTDPRKITFILLDRVYRRLLKKAMEEGKTDNTTFSGSPLNISNPELQKNQE